MRKYALEVKNVSKSFRLPTEQASGIKQAFVNWTKGIKGYKEQKVLKDISFKVKKGDFYGIVGRNGSGKSTLLKIISQIYTPESGTVKVNGTLVPFIELGVGFNPELTGRENIYLNGALLGFSKEEISAMYNEIVEFAELEEFMDQKLKNYSSGMQVRLAFSIAIKAQGDILVLDEVLAVGDEAFQRKCNDFFENIKKDKTKTVILVTHSMAAVKKYCNKAMLIKNGKVVIEGDKDDVANQYTEDNLQSRKKERSESAVVGLNKDVPVLKNVAISKQILSSGDNLEFKIKYKYYGKEKDIFVAFCLMDMSRGGITYDSNIIKVSPKKEEVKFKVPLKLFNSTDFKVFSTLRIKDKKDPKETEMVAFTNEENSLFVRVENEKHKNNYALISNKEMKIHIEK